MQIAFKGKLSLFNCRTGNLHEYTQEENDDIWDMSNINYFHHTIDDIIDTNQIYTRRE